MSDLQLIEAVKSGDLAGVEAQLGAGADPDQRDDQGWTPLCWAAGKGDVALVRALLDAGADAFATGRDLRTPYMIALAAGHAEAVRMLRAAEDEARPDRERPERLYCKAYPLASLKQFPALAEKVDASAASGNGDGQAAGGSKLADEDVVFIHQDYSVTRSMWHGEDVVFDGAAPQWREFCETTLGFKVPDDLDLIAPPADAAQEQAAT
jgi:hypothetical protein